MKSFPKPVHKYKTLPTAFLNIELGELIFKIHMEKSDKIKVNLDFKTCKRLFKAYRETWYITR